MGAISEHYGRRNGELSALNRFEDSPDAADAPQDHYGQKTVNFGELATQQGSPVLLKTLAIINQTDVDAGFKVGDRVKMVIGENSEQSNRENLNLITLR